ncbi:MAG: hypothetical protein ABFD50_15530, partial [Smithella sp.]
MPEWNAVVSIYEHGWKEAFEKLESIGVLTKTPFLNVLLLKANDLEMLPEKLKESIDGDTEPWSF